MKEITVDVNVKRLIINDEEYMVYPLMVSQVQELIKREAFGNFEIASLCVYKNGKPLGEDFYKLPYAVAQAIMPFLPGNESEEGKS